MDEKSKKFIPPGLAYLADNIISKDNILGTSKKDKAEWAKDLKLPGNKETIFFAGCGYQFMGELESMMALIHKVDKSAIGTERMIGLANFQKKLGFDAAGIYRKLSSRGKGTEAQPLLDAVKVLGKLGIDFGYLGTDEPCCGGSLYYMGLHSEFAKHAQDVYMRLKSKGVKRIISIVPSCTYTLRNLIPPFVNGFDLEVKHFVEVVAEKLDSIKLRFPREVKVAFLDPCQLGRYLGLIEEPRKILNAIDGVKLVEPEWTKGEWATCCGGGAGFEVVFPELSQILAKNRAAELVETGAEIIVTHCPGCIMQLKDGLKGLGKDNVEVLDLAQVIAMAMEV